MALLFDLPPKHGVQRDLGTVAAAESKPLRFQTTPPLVRFLLGLRATVRQGRLGRVPTLLSTFGEIATNIELGLEERGDAFWTDNVLLGHEINLLVHDLLEKPAEPGVGGMPTALEQVLEMIRLGLIIWAVLIKRRSRSYPGYPLRYVSHLLRLLASHRFTASDLGWGVQRYLFLIMLWLSAVCLIASPAGSTERPVIIAFLKSDLRRLGLRTWSEITLSLRQMPWIGAFEANLADLCYQLNLP